MTYFSCTKTTATMTPVDLTRCMSVLLLAAMACIGAQAQPVDSATVTYSNPIGYVQPNAEDVFSPPVAIYAQPELFVGKATDGILALQRTSKSSRPRSIDGEQASRSYQRYLKSFETTIPERYETGMDLKKQ